jgi:hypothetical protein
VPELVPGTVGGGAVNPQLGSGGSPQFGDVAFFISPQTLDLPPQPPKVHFSACPKEHNSPIVSRLSSYIC